VTAGLVPTFERGGLGSDAYAYTSTSTPTNDTANTDPDDTG
jgi:hypothetical protein